jgi:hypothetical protein
MTATRRGATKLEKPGNYSLKKSARAPTPLTVQQVEQIIDRRLREWLGKLGGGESNG